MKVVFGETVQSLMLTWQGCASPPSRIRFPRKFVVSERFSDGVEIVSPITFVGRAGSFVPLCA